MEKIIALVILSAPMMVRAQNCSPCDIQEERVYGNFYFETVCDKMSRERARQNCRSKQGWLAEINANMSREIPRLQTCGFFYSGLIKLGDDWIWETNGAVATVSDVNWWGNEPNGSTGGPVNCAAHGFGLEFYEWDCSSEELFMCQFYGYCYAHHNPCQNGGTCVSNFTTSPYYTCTCLDGYYGDTCTDGYCNAYSDTCQNGGICKSNFVTPPYYKCICLDGYYGDTCAEDQCTAETPCKNGGNCSSHLGEVGYNCSCKPWFAGPKCGYTFYDEPTIKTVSIDKCSEDGRLNVTWIPGLRSVNVIHRLQVYDVVNSTMEREKQKTPTENVDQVDNFVQLSPATEYSIKVKVCPAGECTDLEDQKIVTTGLGIPTITENFTVNQTEDDGECIVSWSSPDFVFSESILKFEIFVMESFVIQPETSNIIEITSAYDVPPDISMYHVVPLPNRKYEFHIRTISCAGVSPDAYANGQCCAGNSPPQDVPAGKSSISEPNSTQLVHITLPDESNGPISCMFLIVKFGEAQLDTVDNFGIDNLQQASLSSLSHHPVAETEYLALAARRNEITETNLVVTLGNNKLSWCDVSGSFTDEYSTTFISGKNWPLTIGQSYSYYLVASTANRGVAKFQRSEVTSFQNGVDEEKGNPWIIIGPIFGVLMVVGIVLAFVFKPWKHRAMVSPNGESIYSHYGENYQMRENTSEGDQNSSDSSSRSSSVVTNEENF